MTPDKYLEILALLGLLTPNASFSLRFDPGVGAGKLPALRTDVAGRASLVTPGLYDAPLRDEVIRCGEAAGLRVGKLGQRDPYLDHGTFVPLYFLQEAGVDCPILRIGLSGFPPLDYYRLGQCITQAVEGLGRRAVFVASGDLSHKLKEDGPYGFASEGPEFDRQITEAMAAGDFLRFLTMDLVLCERAAECGLRCFQIMAGALDGMAVEAKLLSYEDVTGVGYGVTTFAVTGPDENRQFGKQCEAIERARLAEKKVSEDPWVRLARLSLETFVKMGKRLERLPDGLPAEVTEQAAGAFVSLHAHGQLRGCIGTTGPTTESVAWEIVHNAVSACSRDPRFPPVTVSELESLELLRGGDLEPGPVAGGGGPEHPSAPVPVFPSLSDDGQASHTGRTGVPDGRCGERVPILCLYGELLAW